MYLYILPKGLDNPKLKSSWIVDWFMINLYNAEAQTLLTRFCKKNNENKNKENK